MARGKQTCKILKEIRRQIAAANGIEFVTSECRYKGDCKGTCPKCEAEVRYLEEQLRARSLSGKRVMLAGVSAGMILLSGCSVNTTNQQPNPTEPEPESEMVEETLMGDIASYEDIEEEEVEPTDTPNTETPVPELLIVGGLTDEEIEEATNTEVVDITEGVGEIHDASYAKPEFNPDSDEPMMIQHVDSKPEFPGTERAMYEWLKENTVYPAEAAEEGIQGRVVVEFVVERDGSLSDIKVVRQRHPALEAEAVRLIETMPQWSPGTYKGKPVRVVYTLPVTFKLQ